MRHALSLSLSACAVPCTTVKYSESTVAPARPVRDIACLSCLYVCMAFGRPTGRNYVLLLRTASLQGMPPPFAAVGFTYIIPFLRRSVCAAVD